MNAVDSTESATYTPPPPSAIVQTYLSPLTAEDPLPEAPPETPEVPVWPPARETVIAAVMAAWPEDPATAVSVLLCESDAGQHPDTYDLEADNGGPMQINWWTWHAYFQEGHGWAWEQVVTDLGIHLQASRIIYDRAGGWFPWSCW
jgi:hypothetical protein